MFLLFTCHTDPVELDSTDVERVWTHLDPTSINRVEQISFGIATRVDPSTENNPRCNANAIDALEETST